MAFCFEKSGAAHEISALLRDTLMEDSPHVTIDMRIARLYLLSDILFNSQQPGVRNAFFYRDALEKMAPDIFTSLGRHGAGQIGRMTMNKLRTAVSAVLGAWTEWSVYNPAFLDELEARFSGKSPQATADGDCKKKVVPPPEVASTEKESSIKSKAEAVIMKARGTWTEVGEQDGDTAMNSEEMEDDHIHDLQDPCDEDLDGSPLDDYVIPGHG
jgi:U2-associated protein SR140